MISIKYALAEGSETQGSDKIQTEAVLSVVTTKSNKREPRHKPQEMNTQAQQENTV